MATSSRIRSSRCSSHLLCEGAPAWHERDIGNVRFAPLLSKNPVFGIITLPSRIASRRIFPHRQRARGLAQNGHPSQVLQSRTESRGHTVFQFRPAKKTSSLPRRALLMGGFAGAVSCAFPGVANAATAIALPAAGGSRRFSVQYRAANTAFGILSDHVVDKR